MKYFVALVVVLFAVPAMAQFGVKIPEKPKGNPEDVTKFVLAADGAFTGVKGLSTDVPVQILEIFDGVLGLKDFPIDDVGKQKYEGLKKEVSDVTTAAKGTTLLDPKAFQESQAKLDGSLKNLMGFMKETVSKDTALKAIGGDNIKAVATKAQGFAKLDADNLKTTLGKVVDAGKVAPAGLAAWGIGMADSYTAKLLDGTDVKKKQIEAFMKNGKENLDLWKKTSEARVNNLKETMSILGIK
jgi:hypothetical protein